MHSSLLLRLPLRPATFSRASVPRYGHSVCSAARIRCYSVKKRESKIEPVDLAYDLVTPENGNTTEKPLVIIHGLFGSKRNWSSLSKSFAKQLDRPVYTLDLRNHGASPHARPMTYPAMAADVLHFFKKHKLQDVALLGHSMGGKVAMTFALTAPESESALKHLIIEDIAPSHGRLSQEFYEYIDLMIRVNKEGVQTRQEADAILASYEQDRDVRAFLLTNFKPASKAVEGDKGQFNLPVDIIHDYADKLGEFPLDEERKWEGKTLFIKGDKSKFLNARNIPLASHYFPNMNLVSIVAGHWVHAEHPKLFMDEVKTFLEEEK